jgi:hypothetical protein
MSEHFDFSDEEIEIHNLDDNFNMADLLRNSGPEAEVKSA